ncbi:MAG: ligase-associated DNA damage response endonuclease PdeM [Alphaproteobacteria bacterium]|nr:ligase-associated DNA damage response endonuclease PdeM [Alphaproteobacteria bacterium]
MSAAPLHMGGERLMLDPSGVLLWPAQGLLAVADLHLEKGSAAAARGRLLPPYDSAATIARLARLIRRHRPARVVALGDSFHDAEGAARLPRAERAQLAALVAATEWHWVLGNHDPAPPAGLGGAAHEALRITPFTFRHEALPGAPAGEICGHHHPRAAIATEARRIARPCFVTDGRRLMLPAFGAYTGGLDVRDPAIAGLFVRRHARAFLLGEARLYSFALAQLGSPAETGADPAPARRAPRASRAS